MKAITRIIIALAIAVVIIAGVFVALYFIKTDKKRAKYTSISMEEAKKIFATPGDYIILDVRTAGEYANGHIPGAINVANEKIGDKKPEELPDTDQFIYVYCRTGHRSKLASAKLAKLGYTNVIEFGGIMSWDGKIEK